jgi:hypothetical protein
MSDQRDAIEQAPCPTDMVERVAKALEDSLWADPSPHGCRLEGPRDGKDIIVYGHVSLDALARAAIAALPQSPGGWQPIETAPKDGTEIDVWVDIPASPSTFGWPDSFRLMEAYCKDGTWLYRVHGKERLIDPAYITHWRPLPPIPAEQKG